MAPKCHAPIMGKPSFKGSTFSLLTRSLAVVDLVVTVMFPFNKHFVIDLLGTDIRSLSLTSCRLFFLMYRVVKFSSSWFLVLMSIERFVAVWFPFRVKQFCTLKCASAVIITTFVIMTVYVAVYGAYNDNMVQGVCLPNFPPTPEWANLIRFLTFLGISIYCLIPALLILSFNLLTIARIYCSKNILQNVTTTSKQRAGSKTWTMLIAISLAFLILNLPITTVHAYATYNFIKVFENRGVVFSMIREIAQVLEEANYVINFFLFAVCNKKFRLEMHRLFKRQSVYHERQDRQIFSLQLQSSSGKL